jgi:hypothetical protein
MKKSLDMNPKHSTQRSQHKMGVIKGTGINPHMHRLYSNHPPAQNAGCFTAKPNFLPTFAPSPL